MWTRYFRLWLVALFVWVAVLGLRAGSLRLVIFPFLALGALLIAHEALRTGHEEVGRTLSTSLLTLVVLYNLYASFPTARSWLESQFPQSAEAAQRWRKELDLQEAEKLNPPALEAREALAQYLHRKEDILGQKIKADLDALNVKRQQGTFGPEDEKKEKEVLKQFQKLVRDRSELQNMIAGSWAEQLTQSRSQVGGTQSENSVPDQSRTDPMVGGGIATAQPVQPEARPTETTEAPHVAVRTYRLTPILPTQSQRSEYEISVQQCIRQSESVHCWGYVKNLTDGSMKLRMDHTYSTFIDDEGNAGTFIGVVGTEHPISGTPVRYEFDFHDSHRNVKLLNFEIKVELEGDPSPRLRYDSFTFKDVPLQTEPTQEESLSGHALQPATIEPEGGSPKEYAAVLQRCDRAKQKIECSGLVTNKTNSRSEVSLYDSRASDDVGNSFFISSGFGEIRFSGGAGALLPNVPVKFVVVINETHQSAKAISLELRLSWQGRYDALLFKNVPIQ
jgi:hypothetical protein